MAWLETAVHASAVHPRALSRVPRPHPQQPLTLLNRNPVGPHPPISVRIYDALRKVDLPNTLAKARRAARQ